jgi:MFS family permease
MLLFRATRSAVGLDTYVPYVALVIGAHLALVHLLWRIALRAANAWIATLLAGVFSVLGAGAENIFWAFQVGFVGGVLLAVAAAYLIDVRELSTGRAIAAGTLGVIAVATAGTALPVMVAAVVLAWSRHGWRVTVAVFGPATVIYLTWYVSQRDQITNEHAPYGWTKLRLIPQYIGSSLVDNLGRTLFAPGIAGALIVALLAFVVARADDLWRRDPLALLLAGSAVLFAATTAMTRAGLGIEWASSGRYTYTVIALLLPLSAIALTRVVAFGTGGTVAVVAFIALVGSYNLGQLLDQANFQAAQEQGSNRLASATLAAWLAEPNDEALGLRPDPIVMPQLTVGGIVDLHEHGWFDSGEYGPIESLTAETYLQVEAAPGSIGINTCETSTDGVVVAPGEPSLITSPTTGVAQLTLANDQAIGNPRRIELSDDPTVVRYDGPYTLTIRGDGIPLTVCRAT